MEPPERPAQFVVLVEKLPSCRYHLRSVEFDLPAAAITSNPVWSFERLVSHAVHPCDSRMRWFAFSYGDPDRSLSGQCPSNPALQVQTRGNAELRSRPEDEDGDGHCRTEHQHVHDTDARHDLEG